MEQQEFRRRQKPEVSEESGGVSGTAFLSRDEITKQKDLALVDRELEKSGIEPLETKGGVESAEARLEKIEGYLVQAADILARGISYEAYEKNAEAFSADVSRLEQIFSYIEIELVSFRARVELDYPKVPFFQKFAVLLLGLVRGAVRESTIMNTFGGHARKRTALFGAAESFEKIIRENRKNISRVRAEIQAEQEQQKEESEKTRKSMVSDRKVQRKKWIDIKLNELLLGNTEYQGFLREIDAMNVAIKKANLSGRYGDRDNLRIELAALEIKTLRIRESLQLQVEATYETEQSKWESGVGE